jgi:replicative DNA helicase
VKLSAPIYHLKRKARSMSRNENIPRHVALDRIAVAEGFGGWSLLAANWAAASASTPRAARLYATLTPGDLVLVGARPRQGKTLLSLELAIEAMKSGNRGLFFSLEYTRQDVLDRFCSIGLDPTSFGTQFTFESSDAISAAYIIDYLQRAPSGTLSVIDYLQLLDQKRVNPDLMTQVRALKAFALETGQIIVFVSQIDRSYDPQTKPCPDIEDIRLPNPLDLSLFDKMCFVNKGEMQFRTTA